MKETCFVTIWYLNFYKGKEMTIITSFIAKIRYTIDFAIEIKCLNHYQYSKEIYKLIWYLHTTRLKTYTLDWLSMLKIEYFLLLLSLNSYLYKIENQIYWIIKKRRKEKNNQIRER